MLYVTVIIDGFWHITARESFKIDYMGIPSFSYNDLKKLTILVILKVLMF